MLAVVYRMLKNLLLPVALGGTARKYVQVASTVDQAGLSRLAKLCGEGRLKVPVDSCWGFEEVLKVSCSMPMTERPLRAAQGIRTDARSESEGEGCREDMTQ